MSEPITLPAPIIDPRQSPSKWDLEYQAFQRLLPQLLTTNRGEYVAIHGGRVVDSGDDKLAVAMRVLSKIGNVAIHVGLVTAEPPPIARSGLRLELQPGGEAS